MPDGKNKLKVVYHEDHQVDVQHVRGEPVVCTDCRYAGWIAQYEFTANRLPVSCLYYSGGADPHDGDRVVFDKTTEKPWRDGEKARQRKWRKLYPFCADKNQDGQCTDFLRAKKPSWPIRIFNSLFRRRAMRP